MKSTVGLGLRHAFHNYVLEHKPAVPWFEVITENYLFFAGAPRSFLHQIREIYPLAFHGVSLSIGSLEPIRNNYLIQLKKMIQEFQPLWVSDHLCWTYNGAENSHDLLPVPLTKKSLQRIVNKTQQVQEFLGQKIYLENPSAYVNFAANDYTEEDFISELCKNSGCGLLLDLNNLVVNKYNLGYDPTNYLNKIKNCDVKQIHLAGHTIKEKVRIDTHDSDISQEVLDLIPLAKQFWPEAKPMIEWDDKIPPIEYLLELRNKIENIWQHARTSEEQQIQYSAPNSAVISDNVMLASDNNTHQIFWKLLKKNDYVTQGEVKATNIFSELSNTPAHIGMNVYSSAYYNRLVEVLEKDFPILKIALNELFSDVMLEYLAHNPSTYDSIDFIGNNLAGFINKHEFSFDLGVDKKIISDIAAFENLSGLCSVLFSENFKALAVKEFTENDWYHKEIKLKSTVLLYKSHSEIHPVIHSVKNAEIPEIPDLKNTYYIFFQENNTASFKLITEEEYQLFLAFTDFKTFVEIFNDNLVQFEKSANLLFQNEQFFAVN